jgi:hypothetical protein
MECRPQSPPSPPPGVALALTQSKASSVTKASSGTNMLPLVFPCIQLPGLVTELCKTKKTVKSARERSTVWPLTLLCSSRAEHYSEGREMLLGAVTAGERSSTQKPLPTQPCVREATKKHGSAWFQRHILNISRQRPSFPALYLAVAIARVLALMPAMASLYEGALNTAEPATRALAPASIT